MNWSVHHGDNLAWLRGLATDSCDVTITDPPYSEETHKGARTSHTSETLRGDALNLVDFAPAAFDTIRDTLAECGRVSRRWLIATMDYRHVAALEIVPPDGLRFVRFGVWVKPNGTPQFTGDRPGTGWEAVAILHRIGGKMTWSGGGRTAVWSENADNASGNYPTQKPLALLRSFVHLFADGSGPILDPWCGSGTSGVAALERGYDWLGCDVRAEAVDRAKARLAAVSRQERLVLNSGRQAGLFED